MKSISKAFSRVFQALLSALMWVWVAPFLLFGMICFPLVQMAARLGGIKSALVLAVALFMAYIALEFSRSESIFVNCLTVLSVWLLIGVIVWRGIKMTTKPKVISDEESP